jgi:hypothetical protein
MTVYHPHGDAFGLLVIVAHNRNALDEATIGATK